MKPICLHDKATIEQICRQNINLHFYALGDLDAFFWPYTTWYAMPASTGSTCVRSDHDELVLVYSGMNLPIVLALTDQPEAMRVMLQQLLPLLPRRFYSHLSLGLVEVLAELYPPISHGRFYKMALTDPARFSEVDTTQVQPLSTAEVDQLTRLYQSSYPGHSFDPRLLETGQYFGLVHRGELVSVAGVHVYSSAYRVAALGNITTRSDQRGRGLAAQTIARLCQSLLTQVDHVGLNVNVENQAAIRCYERLGFEWVATYEEWMIEVK